MALGERAASDGIENECPLCGHTLVGLMLYIKHVGRHLEQLSLFALPSLEYENPEHDSESDEGSEAVPYLGVRSSAANSSEAPWKWVFSSWLRKLKTESEPR